MITTIEALSIMILAIISLPMICRYVNRPSLLYSAYLLVGVLMGGLLNSNTRLMTQELGTIGFILLLFLIGLEIEIPSFNDLRKALPFCLLWFFIQIPLCSLASWLTGFGAGDGFIAGAGINACSLGIAYKILQGLSNQIDPISAKKIVVRMVLLEIITLILLVMSETIHAHGWGGLVFRQAGLLFSFILLIRLSSGMIQQHLEVVLESTNKWRVHRLFLTIFIIVIVGEKLGLSPPKTAFFLGLFMSATTNNGVNFENELKNVAQRILIPIFFISLGARISLTSLFPWTFPAALGITLLLFGIRAYIYYWFSNTDLSFKYFLLFCPNITMVAVATEVLIHGGASKDLIDFLLVTALCMTVGAALMFPTKKEALFFDRTEYKMRVPASLI